MSKGIIYVMTTAVPGLIKIGKTGTDQFKNRMYHLESNGYSNVAALKRCFAIEVDDFDCVIPPVTDYLDKEIEGGRVDN